MKWRKKPIEIDAIQFPDDGVVQCAVARWVEQGGGKLNLYDGLVEQLAEPASKGALWRYKFASIDTLEGVMSVSIGDYIIRGIKGDFYPCKPDIFEATYEKVEPLPELLPANSNRANSPQLEQCPTCGDSDCAGGLPCERGDGQ